MYIYDIMECMDCILIVFHFLSNEIGCYTDKAEAMTLVIAGHDITNVRCALHCQNRGYPISGTSRGVRCYCSYALPAGNVDGFICMNSDNPYKGKNFFFMFFIIILCETFCSYFLPCLLFFSL